MKSIGDLQAELDSAKATLKGVDDNIKRLIGRDPNELPTNRWRTGIPAEAELDQRPKRARDEGNQRYNGPRSKRIAIAEESPDEDDLPNKPSIQSRIIATPKDVKSRQDVLAEQNADVRGKERNRRMFGALLGTLQKFRQEDARMKTQEEKRAKIEKKLEDAAKKEKEELRREKQELFGERKRKQEEIRRIELKMLRMKEQDEWESKQSLLVNFIRTKAEPHLFYLPKIHNEESESRLAATKEFVQESIIQKRQAVEDELAHFEARRKQREEQARARMNRRRRSAGNAVVKEEDEDDDDMDVDELLEQVMEETYDFAMPEVKMDELEAETDENKVPENDTANTVDNGTIAGSEETVAPAVTTAPPEVEQESAVLDDVMDETEFQPMYD